MGKKTSDSVKFTYDEGGKERPMLHIDLPARPSGKDDKVAKTTVLFHFTLKNLW